MFQQYGMKELAINIIRWNNHLAIQGPPNLWQRTF